VVSELTIAGIPEKWAGYVPAGGPHFVECGDGSVYVAQFFKPPAEEED
jgi:hypothetical protein